jgi:hypothetical protein
MDDATYHALARHEHEVKARVYARHGLYRRADSHLDRAAYHASFGKSKPKKHKESKPKKPKEPKVKKAKPEKVEIGLGSDTSDTELDDIPDLVSETYRPEVSRKHSAQSGWSRPSLSRVVDEFPPQRVSTEGYVPRTSPKDSRRFMGSSDLSEW